MNHERLPLHLLTSHNASSLAPSWTCAFVRLALWIGSGVFYYSNLFLWNRSTVSKKATLKFIRIHFMEVLKSRVSHTVPWWNLFLRQWKGKGKGKGGRENVCPSEGVACQIYSTLLNLAGPQDKRIFMRREETRWVDIF